jgi:hypothetical protein
MVLVKEKKRNYRLTNHKNLQEGTRGAKEYKHHHQNVKFGGDILNFKLR